MDPQSCCVAGTVPIFIKTSFFHYISGRLIDFIPGCPRLDFFHGSQSAALNPFTVQETRARLLCTNSWRPHYEEVKALWEDRFEKIYGRWRGFVDHAVWRYLDCGIEEAGFARLKCCDCGRERLLTLSCKVRELCPSCDAKRAAAFPPPPHHPR
jgi:hypothetical protein